MLTVSERIEAEGAAYLTDQDLAAAVIGCRTHIPCLNEVAFATPAELRHALDLTEAQSVKLAAAMELGRRVGWLPPKRGERCLDPRMVYELMRPESREEVESFHVILLDVRGRLLRKVRVATGSLSQCPVSPRDTLRPAVREGAHSIVLCHNHPSGDPSPSADDVDLTDRLRAAAELVGILARDHVIVASGGYYSFVESGGWRR